MTKTKELMTRDMITIRPQEPMAEAYRLMHTNSIRHLPVVDERGKVVGILSDRDIQRAMDVKKINSFEQVVSINEGKCVEDFMSWPVYTVSEQTSIEKVVEEMLSQKVSAFVVSDNLGQEKGIITTDDLLSYLLTMLKNDSQVKFRPIAQYFLNT